MTNSRRLTELETSVAAALDASDGPVVLLDVDGVVNDLAYQQRTPYHDVSLQNGFRIHVPVWMPELIQLVAVHAQVVWCTTWENDANTMIAPLVGAGPFPVVYLTDLATATSPVEAKRGEARVWATRAQEKGRQVVWIEDFAWSLPSLPGLRLVDTTADGVLLPHRLMGAMCAGDGTPIADFDTALDELIIRHAGRYGPDID